jgi:hypothetical protein
MQSHRSATAVVMKEGNVILVSQRHGHPDVYLEEHEKTVLAVPIKVQPKFAGVSSSFSDLLPGAVVGCVEVRGPYSRSRVHAFNRNRRFNTLRSNPIKV